MNGLSCATTRKVTSERWMSTTFVDFLPFLGIDSNHTFRGDAVVALVR